MGIDPFWLIPNANEQYIQDFMLDLPLPIAHLGFKLLTGYQLKNLGRV
jgi:hypothetical protein